MAITCSGIVSKVIDINRGFGEGLWRFLREIMPNPACDRAMLVTTESIGQVSRDSFDAATIHRPGEGKFVSVNSSGTGQCSRNGCRDYYPAGIMTCFLDILFPMNQPEIRIGDLLVPWILVIGTFGFLLAWAVVAILEYTGLSRYVWHLPLFFVALVVLFTSLIGIVFHP